MLWISATAFLAFLGMVSSAPLVERANSQTSPCAKEFVSIITLDAVRLKNNAVPPWKNGAINANNNRFYIGNTSVALCANAQLCDKAPNRAQFVLHHDTGLLHLHVGVLGGQQVYIDKKGALRYNQVREPLPVPWNVGEKGWSLDQDLGKQEYQTLYSREIFLSLACPVSSAKKSTGPWQLFADTTTMKVKDQDVPSKNRKDCTPYSFRTEFVTPLFYNNVKW